MKKNGKILGFLSAILAVSAAAVSLGCASTALAAQNGKESAQQAHRNDALQGDSTTTPPAPTQSQPTPCLDDLQRQFAANLAHSAITGTTRAPGITAELHRVWIENRAGGLVRGSKDGGLNWVVLGKVVVPITGGIWLPTQDNGVLAYNFLRGASNVFASAVNALHIRFSDPDGYKLPEDRKAPLVMPHGVSIYPSDNGEYVPPSTGSRVATTDMHGGTGLFSYEWAPRVGSSKTFMGDGEHFAAIPYEFGPDATVPSRSNILIVTPKLDRKIEYVEFENKALGRVLVKYSDAAQPEHIAKVIQPVLGNGRFTGSEDIPYPGVIRANHPGVFDFGTTDYNTDPNLPTNVDLNDLRGGFQAVPSIHYKDQSMSSGGDHGFVYMVVGPIIDPTNTDRYDSGLEGTAPLFYNGVRAGGGQTYYRFDGAGDYYTIADAVRLNKFKRADGTSVQHLRGVITDTFLHVTNIRYVPCPAGTQNGCEP